MEAGVRKREPSNVLMKHGAESVGTRTVFSR